MALKIKNIVKQINEKKLIGYKDDVICDTEFKKA